MSSKQRKISLWLPYVSVMEVKKDRLIAIYKGGTLDEQIKGIASIMVYGAICPLGQDVLEMSARYKVPICFHRRNVSNVVWIGGGTQGSKDDLLSKQILFREDRRKRSHIARKLLDAKFKSMKWLVAYPGNFKLGMSTSEMRSLEAQHARRYWEKYYGLLGIDGTRRGYKDPVGSVLDAVSKFVSGILLRWIMYHRLSPQHAFLHEPTDYPSLVYDLLEPYRGYIEKAVFNALKDALKDNAEEKEWVGYAIKQVEKYMDQHIYVDVTRQIVTFQELLHGCVLALRAYFIGESQRFIVPIPGRPNGGRPRKVGYKLYGRQAGKTDFWADSKFVSDRQQAKMEKHIHS